MFRNTLPPNPARTLELGRRLTGSVERREGRPLVSVITVVYNNSATLQRCIDSVVAQQEIAVEYIVIDGGSTDGTVDIIRSNSAHIDYAVSEPDMGIYDAMNKGISLAAGDYIALINSDDWLEPDGLKISVNNILVNEAEVSIGFANVWDKHGKFSHVWKIGNFDARILTSGMSFCHQALIASRKAYETIGPFDDKIRISSDYKWIKKLYLSGLKAVFTEHPVVNFSFDGLAANNRAIWKRECKDLLTAQFPFLAPTDVSAFLEYVYRDSPLDQDAVENLVMHAGESPLLLQSLALVLLDRLLAHELQKKHIVPIRNRVPRTEPVRGLLSVKQAIFAKSCPKISVVIPIYNVENYLEQCLRSVMRQSLRDIEIICVNDGSRDGSQAILERLQAEDPRIRIIVKENGGVSSARNAGIRAATGEYVHMLDSDDYIKPGMYEVLYGHAVRNQLDLVKSNLGFIDDVYPVKRPILPKAEVFTFADCPASAQFITISSALYARKLLERVEPFPEGIIYEDRPFNWETLIEARRIGHVDEVFYMYRVGRPGSFMSTRRTNLRHLDGLQALDKIRSLLQQRNLLETFKVEYVKEQLRVYSMVIDIDAIPRAAYGRFFWEMRDRVDADRVQLSEVLGTVLPPRAKSLYAFLASEEPRDASAIEGEKYFFHGMDYAKTAVTHIGSSCELFLIAEHMIEHRIPYRFDDNGNRLTKSIALSLLFDSIHFGTLDSVDSVVEAVCKIERIISDNIFNELITALQEINLKKATRTAKHLAFLSSRAGNYLACQKFLAAYGEARGEMTVFIDIDQVNKVALPSPIAALRRKVIDAICAAGLRPFPFSLITDTAFYVGNQFDVCAVETLTVLFPCSAPERYLIELFRGRSKVIFLPHGMPQLSITTTRPDVVLSVTQDDKWQEIFPNAQIVYAGWPEVFRQQIPLVSQASDAAVSAKRKTILFLSQINGRETHKLDDFLEVASHFITFALSNEGRGYDIILRLRNSAELDLLDKEFVSAIQASPNIRLSMMSDTPVHALDIDLVVSASSTGLLYAPIMGVPLLQLTTNRIVQHWPFVFDSEDSIHFTSDSVSAMARKIESLIAGGRIARGGSPRLSEAETFVRLDGVYRPDFGSKPQDAQNELSRILTAEGRVLRLIVMILGEQTPASRSELEQLIEDPALEATVVEHARKVLAFRTARAPIL